MTKLARKAFAAAVEKFIAEHDIELIDEHGTDQHSHWRRLGTDERMLKVWSDAAGDERLIKRILDALHRAIAWAGSPLYIEHLYHKVARQLAAIVEATDLLDRFCEQIPSYWSALPRNLQDLDSFREQLQALAGYAHSNSTADRSMLAPFLPRSRKRSSVFLVRVHFACVFANEIWTAFGRHHYQEVADIMNVFFNIREGEEITADNVRDAWRDHTPELRFRREGEKITADDARDGWPDHTPGGSRFRRRRRSQPGHSQRRRATNVPRVRTI